MYMYMGVSIAWTVNWEYFVYDIENCTHFKEIYVIFCGWLQVFHLE